MELESYFDFVSPEEIRVKGTRIGIETVLEDYLEGAGPEEIAVRIRSRHMCPLELLPFHDHDVRPHCWSLCAQGVGVSSRGVGRRRMGDGANWGLSRSA